MRRIPFQIGWQYRKLGDTLVRSVVLIAVVLLFCQMAFGQGSTAGVEELYLAKDDGSGKAGKQVTEFLTTDVPIFCVVLLDTVER